MLAEKAAAEAFNAEDGEEGGEGNGEGENEEED